MPLSAQVSAARVPVADPDGFVRLRGADLLVGWLGGLSPDLPPLPEPGDPRVALEQVLLPALTSGRTTVTFSGGRDSSLVLAVATAVARREGLPDPVPVTRVYPDQPDAEEEDCQQAVVRRLGLRDWVRVSVHDEQDLLGPTVAPRLARFGLLFPVGIHSGSLLYPAARGTTMLTGEGGDEVLGSTRAGLLRRAVAARRPLRRTVPAAVTAVRPTPFRRREALRDLRTARPWLRPGAAEDALGRLAAEVAAEPFAWRAAKLRLLRRAGVAAGLQNLVRLAAEHDIRLENPLLDPRFVVSLAAAGERWGWPDRNTLMRHLFGDLLPDEVLQRRGKAAFNAAFVGEHSRRFAEQWDGSGVDADAVDVERLRDAWLTDPAPAVSLPLLQAAWLHAQGIADTGTGAAARAA